MRTWFLFILCNIFSVGLVFSSSAPVYEKYSPGFNFLESIGGEGAVDFHGKSNQKLSGLAYYRWTWSQLEPEEDEINFKLIDDALELAKKNKQYLSFRIMPVWQSSSPKWLAKKGVGFYDLNDGHGSVFPDHNDETFLSKHFLLLEKIASRYRGVGHIAFIDIGSVGCWGEWHYSCCAGNKLCQSFFPSPVNQRVIIDKYFELFSSNGLVGLAASDLKYIVKRGGGWRGDCFGDFGFFSPTSNHMLDVYKKLADDEIIGLAWLNAPVIFETCHSVNDWVARGFMIDRAFDFGIDWHTSFYNNFSRVEDNLRHPDFDRFLKKLGSRISIVGLYFDSKLTDGESVWVGVFAQNNGNAPNYFKISPVVRLVRAGKVISVAYTADSFKVFPGQAFFNFQFFFDRKVASGSYEIQLCFKGYFGCFDTDRSGDGWTVLGMIDF